jgi:uncharacterized protein
MQKLIEKFQKKLAHTDTEFVRDLSSTIRWKNRLIGLRGARGAGKTTLILQHIKQQQKNTNQVLYVSLDDIFFSVNSLSDLADTFIKEGGEYLFFDEVHHYRNWSQEIKNIYDDHQDVHIVFTGSSALHISKSKADLSRRAVMYDMPGLSYREFLKLKYGLSFPVIKLEEILKRHIEISNEVLATIKPIPKFREYLKHGYYPYFNDDIETYPDRLERTINLALETDLPYIADISFSSVDKLKKLLFVIAEISPFKPNVSKLSDKTGIPRNSILQFMHYLEDARIINLLHASTKGISYMQKPEKIYLHHPNLQYALNPENTNIGSLRESFFYNQTNNLHDVTYTEKGDFKIDGKYIFEIGGKSKTNKQISGLPNSFIVSDEIEIGYRNQIPLWLFGFLY